MNQKVALQNLSNSIDASSTGLRRAFHLGAGEFFIQELEALEKRCVSLQAAYDTFQDRQLGEKKDKIKSATNKIKHGFSTQNEKLIDEGINDLNSASLDLKNYVSIQEDNFEEQFSEINKF